LAGPIEKAASPEERRLHRYVATVKRNYLSGHKTGGCTVLWGDATVVINYPGNLRLQVKQSAVIGEPIVEAIKVIQ
tara:strand:- start:19 stop:246 length:228 start_codon:yes stop_codon:yes gene_type:complete